MSLGGKTTETQQIDPALRDAALAQLDMARAVGQLGFAPYKGATVAGMQPGQIAAIQNTNAGLDAFGLNMGAVPTAGDLSPYAIYQEQLAQMAPGQRAFIDSMFINPMTGAAPTLTFGPQSYYNAAQEEEADERERRAGDRGGRSNAGTGGRSTTSMATVGAYLPGGIYTRNPGSVANRVAAALSRPQGAPTQANRPMPRPGG